MITLKQGDDLIVKNTSSVPTAPVVVHIFGRKFSTTGVAPYSNKVEISANIDYFLSTALSTNEALEIHSISFINNNSNTLTPEFSINKLTQNYIIYRASILPNHSLRYSQDGWVISNKCTEIEQTTIPLPIEYDGNLKMEKIFLTSTQTSTVTTLADVPGLQLNYEANSVYYFNIVIPWSAPGTTTGARYTINSASGSVAFRTITANATNAVNVYPTLNAFLEPTTATIGSNGGISNWCTIEGLLFTTSSGTLSVQHATEVAASTLSTKFGSAIFYKKLI